MPIVDIELVAGDPEEGRGQLQALVDELGDLFGSEPGGTWVKLRATDPAGYAENQVVAGEYRPTFVNVQRLRLPHRDERRREMAAVAEIVARTLNRRRENVHVLYAPPAEGRIGFGGELA
ncbi:MAG: hypothetical protein F4Z28_12095 [Gammaproteobacteria bacterium]|nr:hypothetical protein [Gammaproteobacteria bacterium]